MSQITCRKNVARQSPEEKQHRSGLVTGERANGQRPRAPGRRGQPRLDPAKATPPL